MNVMPSQNENSDLSVDSTVPSINGIETMLLSQIPFHLNHITGNGKCHCNAHTLN
jgi:hypothetical protein